MFPAQGAGAASRPPPQAPLPRRPPLTTPGGGARTPEARPLRRPPRPPRRPVTRGAERPPPGSAPGLLIAFPRRGWGRRGREAPGSATVCSGGGRGWQAQGGGESLRLSRSREASPIPKFLSPKGAERTLVTAGRGQPCRSPPPFHALHPQFGALLASPSPLTSSPVGLGSARPLPTPSPGPVCLGPGRIAHIYKLGEGSSFGAAGRLNAAPGTVARQVPSPLGADAQPTYMSAGRRRDSGLAAGAGAAAAGAAPGRRHPSSRRPATRAGRTAESTAPPARSARRVHRARASPPACSTRCGRPVVAAPTRVSAGAALCCSSLGLVPASTTHRALGAAPTWPSSSPPAGAGSAPGQAAGMPGSRGASEGEGCLERDRRASGTEAGVGARAPASPAAAASRPGRPLPPLSPRPGFGGPPAHRLLFLAAHPTCPSPARGRVPTSAAGHRPGPGCHAPSLPLTLHCAFHLGGFSFLYSFLEFLPY